MKKFIPLILLILLIGIGWYFIAGKGNAIIISNDGNSGNSSVSPSPKLDKSPISGLECENADRRPIAVMLGGDAVARPLSGIAQADIVFNMPVITDSITRFMAIFVCEMPKEIGSVRSARHDFIPLARGLDAIFAHWGGSHFALDKLNAGIMDNFDALKDSGSVFYRKPGVVSPYNGFTSLSRLIDASESFGYRLENKFTGYLHYDENIDTSSKIAKTLNIGFAGSYAVKYVYDPEKNAYLRWRGGLKEIDRNINQQVAAKNVVIMRAASRQIEGQYNDVDVEGGGESAVYQNGEEISGTWKKEAANQTSKLYFYDSAGREIKFVPGQIWVEIVQPNQTVFWQ
jgi:hypothetical protein